MTKIVLSGLAIGLLVVAGETLRADIVWDEAINGDLSSDPEIPTPLTFTKGLNTMRGSLSEPDGDLRDYVTFTIGPNQFLNAIFLDAFTPEGISFQALNEGNTSFIPDFGTAGNFLGLDVVSHEMVGTDMMPGLAAAQFGNIGFSIPLGPGTYTYLIQEVTPGESRDYQISFQVIPEPSSAGLFGLLGLATFLRRVRRQSIVPTGGNPAS